MSPVAPDIPTQIAGLGSANRCHANKQRSQLSGLAGMSSQDGSDLGRRLRHTETPVSSSRNGRPFEGSDQLLCKGMIRPWVSSGDQLAVLDDLRGEIDSIRGDISARYVQCIGHMEIEFAVKDLVFDRLSSLAENTVIL